MATGGLYGSSPTGALIAEPGSESSGLYGNTTSFGGTYFEWFVFQTSATQPATPTGGSWNFQTNVGAAPAGWTNAPAVSPTNPVWISIAIVNSRSTTPLVWSTPGVLSYSGTINGSDAPTSGVGQTGELYIQTGVTPNALWFKTNSTTWTQITGAALYATSGANANITSMTGITGEVSTPNHISFDLTPTEPVNEGALYWDTADGAKTLSIVMAGGVVQPVGEKQYYRIKASAAITKGQVTMVTGSVGNSGVLTAAPAFGLTAATAYAVMGIATQNIALNDFGYVASFGVVKQIDTDAFTDGQILYLDPSVAGGLTGTLPTAPSPKVQICAVVQAASNGQLFVRPSFGGVFGQYEGDVDVSGVSANNLLKRNSDNTKWESVAGPSGSVVGTIDTQALTNKTIDDSVIGSVTPQAGTFTTLTATGETTFGTYTGTPLSITGYIEIKTADGVVRKLAVVA